MWCGSADFPTVSFLVFPLVVFSAPRARMFLICSRSFSLSRPSVLPSCRVSTSPADPAAPAAGVKSGKKNPCRHTAFRQLCLSVSLSRSLARSLARIFEVNSTFVLIVLCCGPKSSRQFVPRNTNYANLLTQKKTTSSYWGPAGRAGETTPNLTPVCHFRHSRSCRYTPYFFPPREKSRFSFSSRLSSSSSSSRFCCVVLPRGVTCSGSGLRLF